MKPLLKCLEHIKARDDRTPENVNGLSLFIAPRERRCCALVVFLVPRGAEGEQNLREILLPSYPRRIRVGSRLLFIPQLGSTPFPYIPCIRQVKLVEMGSLVRFTARKTLTSKLCTRRCLGLFVLPCRTFPTERVSGWGFFLRLVGESERCVFPDPPHLVKPCRAPSALQGRSALLTRLSFRPEPALWAQDKASSRPFAGFFGVGRVLRGRLDPWRY